MKMLLLATVGEFFKQRAGMFFVVLGILFGFMSSREHYTFAVFFLTDPFGMLYLFAVWLLYALLCAQFVTTQWALPAYNFIYLCRLWPKPKKYLRYFLLGAALLQPLLYYGIYLVFVGLKDNLLTSVWLVPVFYFLLSSLIAATAEWRILHPATFRAKQKNIISWPFPRPVSWIYWSLEWLFREKGVTLLLCKAGAIGVTAGTLLYYQTDRYDLRLPAIGMSFSFLLNIGLSYELFRWETDIWLWNRSLPVTNSKRFFRIVLLHALLLLPEIIFAARQNVLGVTELLQLYFLGVSIVIFFHVYLYKRSRLPDEIMQPVLLAFVILTLLILYRVPLYGLGGVILLFAYYKFPRWFASV